MDIQCRPMIVSDYGVVESQHWASADQVAEYVERQGIASMLAFAGQQYVGQLYLQEYDPEFSESGGWTGHRPWANFRVAEPLGLRGRFLTLGCYHVGWMPDNSRDRSLQGRGIGTALLEAVIQWYRGQKVIDGRVGVVSHLLNSSYRSGIRIAEVLDVRPQHVHHRGKLLGVAAP